MSFDRTKFAEKRYFLRKRKKEIVIIATGMIVAAFGATIIFIPSFLVVESALRRIDYILIGTTLAISGTSIMIYKWLNTIPPRYLEAEGVLSSDGSILNTESFFDEQLSQSIHYRYTAKGMRDSDFELFGEHFNPIKKVFIDRKIHELEFSPFFSELYKAEEKIKAQIDRLEKNANLNLVIGIITTAVAIVILGSSIFNQRDFHTIIQLLSHYIPRISTVIFVELFSFFFLRLYKKNLDEVKYFQNESSNIYFKITALRAAIKTKDASVVNEIIKNFSVTERNFILKKDESTERIEMQKSDQKMFSRTFESLSEILKGKKE